MPVQFNYKIYATIEKQDKTLEPFISKSNKSSYEYSKRVLNRRWRPAEDIILDCCSNHWAYYDSAEYVYLYAKNVIKKRWPEGEKALIDFYSKSRYTKTKPEALTLYAKYVIKGRWREVESFILQGNQIGNYLGILKNPTDIKEFQNAIQLHALKGVEAAINFNTWKPNFSFKIPGKKAFDVMVVRNLYKDHIQRSDRSPDYLVFQQTEWLDLAKAYHNKNHCRTKLGCHSLIDLNAEEISKNVTWNNNRRYYYTPKDKIPKVELKVSSK